MTKKPKTVKHGHQWTTEGYSDVYCRRCRIRQTPENINDRCPNSGFWHRVGNVFGDVLGAFLNSQGVGGGRQ